MIDDALLAWLGPIAARMLSIRHNLPPATNKVDFEKVSGSREFRLIGR